jgi:hypothetical protein
MLFPNGLLLTECRYEAWFAASRITPTLRSANGASSRLNLHFNRVWGAQGGHPKPVRHAAADGYSPAIAALGQYDPATPERNKNI